MIIFNVYYFYRLKVGDICLIMRNLCVKDGLANNTRVQILDISPLRLRCQTLGNNPQSIVLPRIRFNFRLPYGQSFTMTRLQFPLRRAYCMSIHKSQGQTLGRVLVDARAGFFCAWSSLRRGFTDDPFQRHRVLSHFGTTLLR